MFDNIPQLDVISDDLTNLDEEFHHLLDTYNEEREKLNKKIELTSKSDREDIIKANELFQKRFSTVSEIITKINNILKEIEVGLIVLSAKKLELDEVGSNTDSQFAICCDEFKRIKSEYLALLK